jgi:hypothetical protein
MSKRAALHGRVTNKLQAAVCRSGMCNPRFQFNGLILIVQGHRTATAGFNSMPELESHAPGADVRTVACQRLVGCRELNREINGEARVAKLKSLHALHVLSGVTARSYSLAMAEAGS